MAGNHEEESEISARAAKEGTPHMARSVPASPSLAAMSALNPPDWPKPGEPLNLATHDKPHGSSGIEWWYFHTHLEAKGGRPLAVFGSFFRAVIGKDAATGHPRYGHFITWALTDPEKNAYYPSSYIEEPIKEVLLERLERGEGSKDPRIRRALKESLGREGMPGPDQLLGRHVTVSAEKLDLQYDGSSFVKEEDGRYHVVLEGKRAHCELWLAPRSSPHLHGKEGVVPGREGEEMLYYFVPRLAVEGTVEIKGDGPLPVSGSGWYDHEFGGYRYREGDGASGRRDIAWNWCGMQLNDGSSLTVYQLRETATGADAGTTAVLVLPTGEDRRSTHVVLTPAGSWRSVRTFESYPTTWSLQIPDLGVDLTLEAVVQDQEVITVMSKPSFWEGQCRVVGQLNGMHVTGKSYVERSGFTENDTLDDFFKAVSLEVRKSVSNLLPLEPTRKEAVELFASEAHEHLLQGLDEKEIAKALIAPIRTITDRGGKAWRSYAALACVEALGADCRPYVRWLSLPEIMHSGSLIVDDVEDRSMVRRGGPPAHLLFGDALAINAGTAAYFLAEGTGMKVQAPDKKLVRLNKLFFEGLRAGHAGQALDLAGIDTYLEEAVKTGEVLRLEWRIVGMYRLKTGAPAGSLARMGGVAADGTEEQIEGLGRFFEELGVAFQIIDDVLNLRGFEGGLKDAGEDVAAGKVTLPVAIALARLPHPRRERLAEILRSHNLDPTVIGSFIATLESVGALDECTKRARDMVEDSWNSVQVLLPESLWKVMLRAFCWYVLERHY